MGEVPLARLWQVPDGTTCMLLKDPRMETWEVRVSRGTVVLRREHFSSPIVAMEEAKEWRSSFDPSLQAARQNL
jgi:hypothetical protein